MTTRMLLPPPTLAPRPRRRQQRLDQRPLPIRQIRRITIPSSTHTPLNDSPIQPIRQISDTLIDRKVHLVVAGRYAHRSRKVRAWPADHPDRIELHFLPSYSPEPNPDELVNPTA